MNKEKIKCCWNIILNEIGEDTEREGIKDTPKRIVNMYEELFKGYNTSMKPKITTFDNGKDGIVCDEMIIDEGDFYSLCEHHILPFFGKYYFAYIPNPKGKILWLSKVARVVNYFSSKLQIQERLVIDVVEYIWKELSKEGIEPLGMAMIMRAEHLCKTMRGVKKRGQMTCSCMKGKFRTQIETRNEFLELIK